MSEPAPAPALPGHCLNCGAPLAAPRPRYCGACGQETNVKPPTLLEFAQQFGGSVLAAEGALWRSLRLLLLKPGELTAHYLRGRRRHYVLPLRLYLTLSLLALAALQLFATIKIDGRMASDTLQTNKPPSFTVLDVDGRRAGLADGRFYCERLPGWLCDRLERRLDLAPKAVRRELAELPVRFVGHWGTAMFLMMPLFAALLRLLYRNRGLRYTEHLVFTLHLHAFWSVVMALASLPLLPFSGLLLLTMPVYAFMAARRVYGGRRWATALRGLAVVTLYGLVLALATVVVLLWAVLG